MPPAIKTDSHVPTPKREKRVRFKEKCFKLEGTDQRSLSEAELREKLQSRRQNPYRITSPVRAVTQSRSETGLRASHALQKPKARTIANHGADTLPTQVLFTQKRSSSPISSPTRLPSVGSAIVSQPIPRTKARSIVNHNVNALPMIQKPSNDTPASPQCSSLPSPKKEKQLHLNHRAIFLFIARTALRLYTTSIAKLSLAFIYIKNQFQKFIYLNSKE